MYEVRRARACRDDLEQVFDHLLASYAALGEAAPDAFDRAVARMTGIEDSIDALARGAHQGTLWPEVMDGLRWITKDHAILYFVADDAAGRIDVLAVFFGGQDHKEHMLDRIRNSL